MRLRVVVASFVAFVLVAASAGDAMAGRRPKLTIDTAHGRTTFIAGEVAPIGGVTGIGNVAAPAQVLIAIDVSPDAATVPGPNDCDDANDDGTPDTLLDCEIAGVMALNGALGVRPNTQVGIAVFQGNDAAAADVGPAAGVQSLTTPITDANGNGTPDVEEVVRSIEVGAVGAFSPESLDAPGGNSYDPVLEVIDEFTNASLDLLFNAILSTAERSFTTGPGSTAQVLAENGVPVDPFVLDAGACSDPSPSLELAQATGGRCTAVGDVSNVEEAVTSTGSKPRGIKKLKVSFNGVGFVPSFMPLNIWHMRGADAALGDNVAKATAIAKNGSKRTAQLVVAGI